MNYKDIVSVTGIGGLFHLLTTKSDGAVVRNISDNTTKFISARLHNVTPLESIEVYTQTDNVRLHEVFQKMKDAESTTPPVEAKKANNDEVKAYFNSIFPDFDQERVYVSDMKKMLKWYRLLKDKDLLNFEDLNATEEAEVEEGKQEEKAPKPAKKAPKKKAAADKEEKPAAKKKAAKKKAPAKKASGDAKPAAKKTAKKKTEE